MGTKREKSKFTTPVQNGRGRGAFTLMDVLVSLLIIAILIGLLLPVLGKANEVARRVICQSNVRQLGIGMLMYADANQDYLPHSRFVAPLPGESQIKQTDQMILARLESDEDAGPRWDGLGHLYHQDYIPAPGVFYCPSHSGSHRYNDELRHWQNDIDEVTTNYHDRGEGPSGPITANPLTQQMTMQLFRIDPAQSSLIADAMRTTADLNHRDGLNFFRADLTVHWFRDDSRQIGAVLSEVEPGEATASMNTLWGLLDQAANVSMSAERR